MKKIVILTVMAVMVTAPAFGVEWDSKAQSRSFCSTINQNVAAKKPEQKIEISKTPKALDSQSTSGQMEK